MIDEDDRGRESWQSPWPSGSRRSTQRPPFAMDDELAGLGYVQHSAGPKSHAVYVRSDSGPRTHILHVFNSDQWTYCNQRLFRDKLLHDADARRQYQALKRSRTGMVDGRQYSAARSPLEPTRTR